MLIIVCYDVNTETREGRRRLRRVAKVCEGVGQRVQKSVFEFQIDLMRFEALERSLLAEIDLAQDNLRLYRLPESRGAEVREYGVFRATDFNSPLVL
ncbi:MAG: CRISPR-associated endonuclease Cas2 [Rhodocyclaceae bacterium]|nr:CRISPR-associated endonuclease Cas2 [Rhodocyclaceae bacterium]